MDILKHNEIAWDKQSSGAQSPWVQPVPPAEIDAARQGQLAGHFDANQASARALVR
jgi:hypothetical protein